MWESITDSHPVYDPPTLMQEIIKLKGRRVLAGEDSFTTLFQTLNTIYVRTCTAPHRLCGEELSLLACNTLIQGAGEGECGAAEDCEEEGGGDGLGGSRRHLPQPPPITPAIKDLLPKVSGTSRPPPKTAGLLMAAALTASVMMLVCWIGFHRTHRCCK